VTVGDDITDEPERVPEDIADEVRHRDAEVLRFLAELVSRLSGTRVWITRSFFSTSSSSVSSLRLRVTM